VRRLDRGVATKAIAHLTEQLAAKYGAHEKKVADHLHRLEADIAAHAAVLTSTGNDSDAPGPVGASTASEPSEDEEPPDEDDASLGVATPDESQRSGSVPLDEDLRQRPTVATLLRRYRVNVLVHHAPQSGAPIVHETNPSYHNLLGRIELGLRDGLPYA